VSKSSPATAEGCLLVSVFSSCSCRAGGRVIHHESILGEEEEGIVALRDDEEAKTHPP